MKRKTKNIITICIVIFLIVFAWLSRLDAFSFLNLGGLVRPFIYILLYAAWGISLAMRLVHPHVRRYMSTCASLMMF